MRPPAERTNALIRKELIAREPYRSLVISDAKISVKMIRLDLVFGGEIVSRAKAHFDLDIT